MTATRPVRCTICNRTFTRSKYHPRARTCSHACAHKRWAWFVRDAPRPKVHPPCRQCSGQINPYARRDARSCTPACSQRWRARRRHRLEAGIALDYSHPPCRECGGTIPVTRRAGSIYCSKRCSARFIGREFYRQHTARAA